MLSKTDLLNAILKECRTCIHLHGKIPEGALDYRPTPKQRSTLELLRYLSFCGFGFADAAVSDNWDSYMKLDEAAKTMEAPDFPQAMKNQMAQLTALFASISDDDFANKEVVGLVNEKMTLGVLLLDSTYRFMVGYKMQLFLYIKASGGASLGTDDCWFGECDE